MLIKIKYSLKQRLPPAKQRFGRTRYCALVLGTVFTGRLATDVLTRLQRAFLIWQGTLIKGHETSSTLIMRLLFHWQPINITPIITGNKLQLYILLSIKSMSMFFNRSCMSVVLSPLWCSSLYSFTVTRPYPRRTKL